MRLINADAFDERVRVAGGMSEDELTDDFKDGVQAVLYMLSNQPTITPEPHWIPVEQELPEYGKAVLTITQDETYEVNHVIDEECGEWFWEDNGKVIAWMPLPEPYKGVTE